MKTWLAFVIGAGLCWGTYVPLIAYGGKSLSNGTIGMGNRFAAILCVGGAYVLLAVLVPLGWFMINGSNNAEANGGGITFSGLAGAAGALGAICVVFATAAAEPKDRIFIAPLIFAMAPVINTLVSLVWHPSKAAPFHFSMPSELPDWKLFVGIIFAAIGAGLVLYSKEEIEASHAKQPAPKVVPAEKPENP